MRVRVGETDSVATAEAVGVVVPVAVHVCEGVWRAELVWDRLAEGRVTEVVKRVDSVGEELGEWLREGVAKGEGERDSVGGGRVRVGVRVAVAEGVGGDGVALRVWGRDGEALSVPVREALQECEPVRENVWVGAALGVGVCERGEAVRVEGVQEMETRERVGLWVGDSVREKEKVWEAALETEAVTEGDGGLDVGVGDGDAEGTLRVGLGLLEGLRVREADVALRESLERVRDAVPEGDQVRVGTAEAVDESVGVRVRVQETEAVGPVGVRAMLQVREVQVALGLGLGLLEQEALREELSGGLRVGVGEADAEVEADRVGAVAENVRVGAPVWEGLGLEVGLAVHVQEPVGVWENVAVGAVRDGVVVAVRDWLVVPVMVGTVLGEALGLRETVCAHDSDLVGLGVTEEEVLREAGVAERVAHEDKEAVGEPEKEKVSGWVRDGVRVAECVVVQTWVEVALVVPVVVGVGGLLVSEAVLSVGVAGRVNEGLAEGGEAVQVVEGDTAAVAVRDIVGDRVRTEQEPVGEVGVELEVRDLVSVGMKDGEWVGDELREGLGETLMDRGEWVVVGDGVKEAEGVGVAEGL